MIDFVTLKGLETPDGVITQITDANGKVLWSATRKVKVTIKSQFLGMNGDTSSITIKSMTPFAPDPANPNYKVTSWTVSVADEPNCTIEIPVGSTIECTVSRDKGNADSYIRLNGTNVVTGEGNYIYTVTEGVTITIADKYSQGDYGMITIVEESVAILEVEKITSNTYAGETTYENEEFILLDIYPKTNGTVKVTYGGLTKTITDTSGAEEPNAQQVYFGTFNGVADSVETPASGALAIEGDYVTFGVGSFVYSNKGYIGRCSCITGVSNWGSLEVMCLCMFYGCTNLKSIQIPDSITDIPLDAFNGCTNLTNIQIPNSITSIGIRAFKYCENLELLVIPEGVTSIGMEAFYMETETVSGYPTHYNPITKMVDGVIILPTTIQNIDDEVWGCSGRDNTTDMNTYLNGITLLSTIPPNITEKSFDVPATNYITVPKGCGEIYKNAPVWSNYANRIVEAT